MITAALIVVVILGNTHHTNGLKPLETEIDNILTDQTERNQKILDYEVNNDNLIKLINKATRELNQDLNKRHSVLNVKRNKNKSSYKSLEKPDWLKLHQKHGGFNDELNEVKENKFYEDPRKPNDFNKVYLILNPESALTSSDVRDLSKVVSSLLSKSQYKKNVKHKHYDETMRRYRGFLMGNKRRRLTDSKEKFAKDSIERDYKPKRVRSDYGGGGRTAIPYIRHRGDIYERD